MAVKIGPGAIPVEVPAEPAPKTTVDPAQIKAPQDLFLARILQPDTPASASLYQDPAIRVIARIPAKVSRSEAQQIANTCKDAGSSVMVQQGLGKRLDLQGQLTINVLNPPDFREIPGGEVPERGAIALGDKTIALSSEAVTGASVDLERMLGREMARLLDTRAAKARLVNVPAYVQEGKAAALADAYIASRHPGEPNAALSDTARIMGLLTPVQAQEALNRLRGGESVNDWTRNPTRDRALTSLYVAFLQSRMGGGVFPDAGARLARIIDEVGHGAAYEAVFAKQFKASPSQSEQDFVYFMEDTDGAPEARLDGMIYASYLLAPPDEATPNPEPSNPKPPSQPL